MKKGDPSLFSGRCCASRWVRTPEPPPPLVVSDGVSSEGDDWLSNEGSGEGLRYQVWESGLVQRKAMRMTEAVMKAKVAILARLKQPILARNRGDESEDWPARNRIELVNIVKAGLDHKMLTILCNVSKRDFSASTCKLKDTLLALINKLR